MQTAGGVYFTRNFDCSLNMHKGISQVCKYSPAAVHKRSGSPGFLMFLCIQYTDDFLIPL
jgi:hypothetical protein